MQNRRTVHGILIPIFSYAPNFKSVKELTNDFQQTKNSHESLIISRHVK